MYTPPMFKPDRAASLAFAQARGFGTVCAWDGSEADRILAAVLPRLMPMTARRARRFMSRAAIRWQGSPTANRRWLMAVNGADAYVSAGLVRLAGSGADLALPGRASHRPVRMCRTTNSAAHLDALSAKFESWLAPKPPWTAAKMTAGRLDAMKKAIVGLVMSVEEVEGSFKLNQHKSDADHGAISKRTGTRSPIAPSRQIAHF